MKKTFTHFPFFYILITFYPLLFLWAQNISQVDPVVVVRPFIFTLIGSAILYGILYLIFRDGLKAALVGSLLLVAFFSYGHVYYGARAVPALKTLFHNSTLIPLYLLLFGLAILGVLRLKKYGRFVLYLNIISLFLVGLQAVALSDAYIRGSYAARQPVKVQSGLTLTTAPRDMPDIYVIVLDTYMRSDALEQDLGYDNSPFVGQLTNMGFYVVACSRPNYTFTYASIAALLNMRYIPQAYENTDFSKVSDKGFWSILKNDEVRQQLKSVGYSTVAFQEEYPSLQFNDSDILIGMENVSINSSHMYPFEIMYRQSTAAIILDALDSNGRISKYFQTKSAAKNTYSAALDNVSSELKSHMETHVILTQFALDRLPDIPAIAGPKFTFVQIFIPHLPYVFGPDGEIMTDPGYYDNSLGYPANVTYEKKGYINQVQFIDKRILPVLQTIIKNSKNPPIIILMGDHGLNGNNRRTNLLAYYLPGKGSAKLYPTISLVNSFRLIFDEYFEANYPLLPDETYITDTTTAPDAYPDCAP